MLNQTAIESLFHCKRAGGMRAKLFGAFYEDIWRGYLPSLGFKLMPGKPRIYWTDIKRPADSSGEGIRRLTDELDKKLRSARYCTPDGLLECDGQFLVWEAKNWIRELFPSPTLAEAMWTFPWLLADEAHYQNRRYPVSGFVISWWKRESGIHEAIAALQDQLGKSSLRVFFTTDMLEDCVTNDYDWYRDLIAAYRDNVSQFFDGLLGEIDNSSAEA
jgi:hypothetical protein